MVTYTKKLQKMANKSSCIDVCLWWNHRVFILFLLFILFFLLIFGKHVLATANERGYELGMGLVFGGFLSCEDLGRWGRL